MPEAKEDAIESAPKKGRPYKLLGGGLLALLFFLAIAVLPDRLGSNVVLGHQNFRVDVAATAAQQEQGLSGRTGLADRQGMLFVFQDPDTSCFWMKDMEFDIDILWFDEGRHLIHQAKNLSPDTYPAKYCPPRAAKYVLEVPAGTADRLGLKDGDDIEVNL
ncbi:MAG TPA: DUF192 domain-containing protein [Verrucomicrobiae bacterium]|nr:DUF192 domain-containing protein [Verrucomicrobiae bacterium]